MAKTNDVTWKGRGVACKDMWRHMSRTSDVTWQGQVTSHGKDKSEGSLSTTHVNSRCKWSLKKQDVTSEGQLMTSYGNGKSGVLCLRHTLHHAAVGLGKQS